MELVGRVLTGSLLWLVGPDYALCRPEFGHLIDAFTALDAVAAVSFPADDQCRLVLCTGAEIVPRSAREPARLAGQAPDGVVGCESAQLSHEAFLRLRGRVAEKRGWLWLSGTFESSLGWYAETYAAWRWSGTAAKRAWSWKFSRTAMWLCSTQIRKAALNGRATWRPWQSECTRH